MALDRVRVSGFAGFGEDAGHRSEMAAGAETHHADAVRSVAVLRGEAAHQAHRAARVLERNGVEICGAEAVFEDEDRDAESGEAIAGLTAFKSGGETDVGAARGDNHRGAVGVRGTQQRECGDVDRGVALRAGRRAVPKAEGGDPEGWIERCGRDLRGREWNGCHHQG